METTFTCFSLFPLRKKAVFVWLFLLNLLVFSANAQDFEQVEELLEKGDYQRAVDLSNKAYLSASTDKDKGQWLLWLSKAYRQQGSYAESLASAVQATTFFDRSKYQVGKADAYIEIGLLYQNWLAYEKAIENFQKAKRIYETNNQPKDATESLRKIAHAQFAAGKYAQSQENYEELLKKDRQSKSESFLSFSLGKLAIVTSVEQPQKSLEYLLEKYQIEKKGTNYRQIAYAANGIGYLYRQLGQEQKSISYFEEAIQALKKVEKKDELVWNNLGVTYTSLKKYPSANESYEIALGINQEKDNQVAVAESYNYLAANEYLSTHSQEAKVYVKKAIDIAKQNEALEQLADAYSLLAKILEYEGDFKLSQEYFKKFTQTKDQLKAQEDKQKEALAKQRKEAERRETRLVQLEDEKEKERLRLQTLQSQAERQAKENDLLKKENELKASKIQNQLLAQAQADAEKRQAQQALQIARQALEAEKQKTQLDQLAIKQAEQKAQLKEQELAAERDQRERERLQKESKLKELETDQQRKSKYIAYIIAVGAFLLLGVAIFGFYKNNQKNKQIQAQNDALEEQQQEISIKNDYLQASEEELRQNSEELKATNEQLVLTKQSVEEKNLALASSISQLEEQKSIIEKKNHDITSSINYAQRIQQAMLPDLDKIKAAYPDSFVFFQPRDIVSGDFYWFSKVSAHKSIISAIDCTGHGVPGAFMSLIGNDSLNEIVNARNVHEADQILHDLHSGVITALNQRATDNRDGMDMALCVVHHQDKRVDFAGAKNGLIYIQNKEVFQLKGDKMPIGGERLDMERFFEKQTINVTTPTTFYIFSDGFQDQFGGERGRKYMKKRFREFLLEIHEQPFDEQEQILKAEIESWMGNEHSQIDDILVIGFRIA